MFGVFIIFQTAILYLVSQLMYREDSIVMNILSKIRFSPSCGTHENLTNHNMLFNLKNSTKTYNFVQIDVAFFSKCWVVCSLPTPHHYERE